MRFPVMALAFGLTLCVQAAEGFRQVFIMSGDGHSHRQFSELEVFREGVPSFPVAQTLLKDGRITPFRKHSEYRKLYVDRNARLRKTPYRITDILNVKPEDTVDSDYVKNGGEFFIYERISRPPYFLPTDGCPLADREHYRAWIAERPGFQGFNSLWEFDSDSRYFQNFYWKIWDKSIADELHGTFPAPETAGLGHILKWWRLCFRIGADFHFGETRVNPLCSNQPGFEHIFAANGANKLWYEATTQSPGPWALSAAFVRGAARQWRKEFCWYMAQYYTGFNRKGEPRLGDSRWISKDLSPATVDASGNGPYRGESRSLHRRQILLGWLSGAKYMQTEGWPLLYKNVRDGHVVPSENALDLDEIYRLAKRVERGESYTPLCLLTPLNEPTYTSWRGNAHLLDPQPQADVYETLLPMTGDDGVSFVNRKKGEQGCLFNSEIPAMFDCLCPDSGQDTSAFAAALGRYRYALVVGRAFDGALYDEKALAEFARKGGRVLRYPSEEIPDAAALRRRLQAIRDETMPFSVAGDCHWGVNRTPGGWLVWVMNNKGVVKFCDEPEEFDGRFTAKVVVAEKGTGRKTELTVKPGRFALVEFAAGGEPVVHAPEMADWSSWSFDLSRYPELPKAPAREAGAKAFSISDDSGSSLHRCGEKTVFTLKADPKDRHEGVKVRLYLDRFGGERIWEGEWDQRTDDTLTVEGSLDEPGFLRLVAVAVPQKTPARWALGKGNACWSVGYEPERIRPGSERPADFDAYWDGEIARLDREVPLDARKELVESRSDAEFNVWKVSFANFGGKRVWGFLAEPKDLSKGPYPLHVTVPGAGPACHEALAAKLKTVGEIRLVLNVHPYEPAADQKGQQALYAEQNRVYAKLYGSDYAVAGGGVSREAFFFHDAIVGLNRAVTWAAALPEVDKSKVVYSGGSQGGGMGCALVALNPAIRRAAIKICALSDHCGHRNGHQSGWPLLVKRMKDEKARNVAETLVAPYFDAAHFAARIKVPTLFSVGFSDTTCPPPCVYAAYNSLGCAEKKILNVPGMGHSSTPEVEKTIGEFLR